MHSALSLSERLDEYKRIRRGEVDVVVGTRSAVFAPVEKLGLIIVDEEQEHTYRSEKAPRYDAGEIARLRARRQGGLCVLASATPSIETAYRAEKGEYLLAKLTHRYGGAPLPDVTILDLRERAMAAEALSEELCEELMQNLDRGEPKYSLCEPAGLFRHGDLHELSPAAGMSPLLHQSEIPRRQRPTDVPLLRLQHRGAEGLPPLRQPPDAVLRRRHAKGGGGAEAPLSPGKDPPHGSGHHHAQGQSSKAPFRLWQRGL